MLSFGRVDRGLRRAACGAAALAFSLVACLAFNPAQAQELETGGCVGNWHASNCVTRWAPAGDPFIRQVPPPAGPGEQARAREHYRRWADRCRPSIRQDRYGVARYHYALPGCEFGVGEY